MVPGLLFALAACLLWGTIFVVPQFLPDFSIMEVALGRYFSYGLFSAFLLLIGKIPKYPLRIWIVAFTYGLVANVVYYICIVIGVRYATPPVTVLVVGMCPVFAAIYGNLQSREFPFRGLLISCVAMMVGIALVNVMEIDWSFSHSSLKEYLIGLCGAFTSLVTWGIYAVQNAKFLKCHPDLSPTKWASMIGVSTLFWAFLLMLFLSSGENKAIDLEKFMHFTTATVRFFLWSAFLGIACAWLGCYLWNRASSLLPISIMGPMIIFETLFGLTYVFLYEMRAPTALECAGIVLMFCGIWHSFSLQRKQTPIIH